MKRFSAALALVVLGASLARAAVGGIVTFPAGTTGQLEYNNGGLFGGVAGSSVSGQNLALSGSFSAAGGISGPVAPSSIDLSTVTARFVTIEARAAALEVWQGTMSPHIATFDIWQGTASVYLAGRASSGTNADIQSFVNAITFIGSGTVNGGLLITGVSGAYALNINTPSGTSAVNVESNQNGYGAWTRYSAQSNAGVEKDWRVGTNIGSTGANFEVYENGQTRAWLNITTLTGYTGIGQVATPATMLDVYGNAQFGQIKKATFTVSGGLELPYGFVSSTGSVTGLLTVGSLSVTDDIEFSGFDPHITANTADGVDISSLTVAGGGNGSANINHFTRGGALRVYGNENAVNPGDAILQAGTVTGGEVRLMANGSNGLVLGQNLNVTIAQGVNLATAVFSGAGAEFAGAQNFSATPTGYGRVYGLSGQGLTLQGEAGSAKEFSIVQSGGGHYWMWGLGTGDLVLAPNATKVRVGGTAAAVATLDVTGDFSATTSMTAQISSAPIMVVSTISAPGNLNLFVGGGLNAATLSNPSAGWYKLVLNGNTELYGTGTGFYMGTNNAGGATRIVSGAATALTANSDQSLTAANSFTAPTFSSAPVVYVSSVVSSGANGVDLNFYSATAGMAGYVTLNIDDDGEGIRVNPGTFSGAQIADLELFDNGTPEFMFRTNDTSITEGQSIGMWSFRDQDTSTGGTQTRAIVSMEARGAWGSSTDMDLAERHLLAISKSNAPRDVMVMTTTGTVIMGFGLGSLEASLPVVACGTCTLQTISPSGHGVSIVGNLDVMNGTATITAGQLNVPSQFFVSLSSVTRSSLEASVATQLFFVDVETMTAGGFDPVNSSGTINIPYAGRHTVTASYAVSSANTDMDIFVYLIGVEWAANDCDPTTASANSTCAVTKKGYFNVGDALTVKVYHNAATGIRPNKSRTFFQVAKD